MAGTLVSVLRRTELTVGGNQPVVLGPQLIDTLGWVSGVLIVRFYVKTTLTQNMTINVQNVMLAPEDEVNVVQATSAAGAATYIATVTLGTADTVGSSGNMYSAQLSTPIARYVRVMAIPGNAASTVTVGIDLLGRSA